MPFTNEEEQSIGWQKPDWTKNTKLRSTGKSAADNLAKPITNLPHQKECGPGFSKPEWTDEVCNKDRGLGDKSLAKPITELAHGADPSLAFEKPEWTKNAGLNNTGKLEKMKEGKDIARPIGGIRPVD